MFQVATIQWAPCTTTDELGAANETKKSLQQATQPKSKCSLLDILYPVVLTCFGQNLYSGSRFEFLKPKFFALLTDTTIDQNVLANNVVTKRTLYRSELNISVDTYFTDPLYRPITCPL